jgi:hypothetical protein
MNDKSDRDLATDVREFVRPLVARGDNTFTDIFEGAVEYLSETYDDEAAVKAACEAEISEAFADHFQAQATWPAITDCDRLDRAFAALNERGIVARHDFSCCQNCGLTEIGDEVVSVAEGGKSVTGFTFYHAQDTDRATQGDGLYLTFGHIDGSEENGTEIGRLVVKALGEAGLETNWDETFGKRISVLLEWKRRIPPSAVLRLAHQ